ncbi:hypothetical protein Tco_1448210 [Tanacetum coccineum]
MDCSVGLCAGPFSWGPAPGGKGACIRPGLANVETLATSDKKEQTTLRKAIKARIVRHLLVDVSDELSRPSSSNEGCKSLKSTHRLRNWMTLLMHGGLMFYERADDLKWSANALEWLAVKLARRADALNQRADSLERRL